MSNALMNSAAVRKELGGISEMTRWRWQQPDSPVQFPAPDVIINGRNHWYEQTIRRFQKRLEKASPAASHLIPPRREARQNKRKV
jgi:hypothetical protein